MKRCFLLLISAGLLLSSIQAQQPERLGQHTAITSWTAPQSNLALSAQGKQIAQQIIDVVGLKPNFEIQAANIENAAAIVFGGKRYVLFNPAFIGKLIKTTGTDWAAISVLAHEIGHHLNGHTLAGAGNAPAMELEADEFSGYVLRKMGASLQQAQAAMKTLASEKASYTHPAQYDRLASIEKGWDHANNQLAGRSPVELKPINMQPEVTNTAKADIAVSEPSEAKGAAMIIGDVYFNTEPAAVFHITTRMDLVRLRQDGVQVLGTLSKTGSSQFPYTISDELNTMLWVSNRGVIINRQGKQVGYLRNHTA